MRLALAAFTAAIALLLIAGAGGTARMLFPWLAAILAVALFLWARDLYMDFVLWCWFLSPFLRRVMDYQAGWQDPSIVVLTPYIVALIAPLCAWKRLTSRTLSSILPFVVALCAIVYGASVGIVLQPLTAIVASAIGWGTPVLFAWWYASSESHDQDLVERSTERTFIYALVVMGAYGLFQFVYAPAWDANWLVQLGSAAEVASMGAPEPYQLRVFSTLNSAGVLALMVSAGLLLSSAKKTWLSAIATVCGLGCLLLSQGRSGWLCFAVGLILLAFRGGKSVIRTLAIGSIAGLLLLPILLRGPGAEGIQSRFSSVGSLKSDESANERKRGFSDAIDLAVEHPAGFGMGVKEDLIADDGSYSLHDNGVVEALLTLGLAGGVVYLAALFVLVFSRVPTPRVDARVYMVSGVVALAFLSQLPFGSVFLGPPGFVLWLFAAISARQSESQVSLPLRPEIVVTEQALVSRC
jgi:O-Antigen ligase